MLSVFIPVVLACQAEVSNPAEDCKVYFGGTFNSKEACIADFQINGLPYMQQVLPEGGSIEDITCLELKASEGSNL